MDLNLSNIEVLLQAVFCICMGIFQLILMKNRYKLLKNKVYHFLPFYFSILVYNFLSLYTNSKQYIQNKQKTYTVTLFYKFY